MQKPEIKPGDFPVEADKDTLRTSKGKTHRNCEGRAISGRDRWPAQRTSRSGRAGSVVGLTSGAGGRTIDVRFCAAGTVNSNVRALS